MAAKAEIEESEARLQNKDEEMSQMQQALLDAQQHAQELSEQMSNMHVKEEESEQDQLHAGRIHKNVKFVRTTENIMSKLILLP